ncbi:MAG: ABC transporter ATP-binding protein [Lachnospiraceae bacterium]|nr:ABC transporter ATP-binding protein [Lachnospiraceae bacterium]
MSDRGKNKPGGHTLSNVLILEGIEKSFGKTRVLRGIDLEIARGEFLTLLGSSGCGKTTTLRIVAGLETPDRGRVLLNGEDVTEREPWQRNVNTVFQNYALFPHMDVAANIGYSLKLKKKSRPEIARAVTESLKLVQLEGYEKRMPSELSGGQRQRVAIARALVNEPQVLLLDEPLGALDLQLRRQMQTELKRLQKRLGITFIYITHDQEEALNMSDRIAVMREGRFVQIGSAQEIYDRPRTSYVARFVGNANIIRVDGRMLAVRSEQILLDGQETPGALAAVVKEKSFVGGMLRIGLELTDGTPVTASRHGIDAAWQPGERLYVSWRPEHGVPVEKDETAAGEEVDEEAL